MKNLLYKENFKKLFELPFKIFSIKCYKFFVEQKKNYYIKNINKL